MQWGLRKGESTRRRERELCQECEVYLSGHYAEYLDTRNRTVPNWAWLGVLAHGRPEQLRALVADKALFSGTRTRTTAWWQAIAFLAEEILSQHNDDRGLDDLRRSVLVPLELEWLAADRPMQRPGQLVRSVLDALDQYPSSRRR